MEDISSALAYEVKKELAERYFGFRKIIEEDSKSYQEEIALSAISLEEEIGSDIIQIYTCLQSEKLICDFSKLIGLKEGFFFDKYISINTESSKQVFACKRVIGFTRKLRLRNALYDAYEMLYMHISDYNEKLEEIMLKHETIRQQINIFYKRNDFTGIMQFLRSLDGSNAEMAYNITPPRGSYEKLEQDMQITAPPPAEEFLPELPAIPPLREIKPQLKKLADQAWKTFPDLDPRYFCS